MPAFSISPAGPFPPPGGDEFPNYLQIQSEGENLGTPTADTLNFTGDGVTVTRGAGENVNKVTVDIPGGGGGGGGSAVAAFTMAGVGMGKGYEHAFSNWTAGAIVSQSFVSWDQDTQRFVFNQSGIYLFTIRGRITLASGLSWNDLSATAIAMYGTFFLDGDDNQYFVGQYSKPGTRYPDPGADFPKTLSWTDAAHRIVSSDGESVRIQLFFDNYDDNGSGATFEPSAEVFIERIGDVA